MPDSSVGQVFQAKTAATVSFEPEILPYIDQMRGMDAGCCQKWPRQACQTCLSSSHRRLDQRRQHPHDHHLRIGAGGARRGAQGMRFDDLSRHVQRLLPAVALQLAAGHEEDRRHAALPGQAQRAVHQQRVAGGNARAFQPHARHFDVLAKAAVRKGQAGGGQAEGGHVPADQLGAGRQFHRQAVFSQAAAVADGFERQPFHARAGLPATAGCAAARARRSSGKSASRRAW